MKYDFGGWATKNDIRCADGKTIRQNAFKNNDGKKVPLVWNHDHDDPDNVLGHAILENRPEGVYAYCSFNETESGLNAKELVAHGDIDALSIWANRLVKRGDDVLGGDIKELSMVLAGANPGAYIDVVSISHGDDGSNNLEAIISIVENEPLHLAHSDDKKEEGGKKDMGKENSEKTVGDVFDEFTDEQKDVVYAMIGAAVEQATGSNDDGNDDNDEEDDTMKHNIFDKETGNEDVLSHADMVAIIADGKKNGSLRDAVLAHGIDQIDYLFPEAQTLTNVPQFIQRDMGWVQKVMAGVHKTPFSRIKSVFADITEDDARAKGYIKGKLKKEEVFSLLKRTTTPQTIYKKQKLDRDDIIDITDFDVVAWLKGEMRMMLDEELARAFLVGDGRLGSSDDKINEQNIRPIWTDADLYTVKKDVVVSPTATDNEKIKSFIRTAIKSRKDYKGSGSPTMFTTEDVITDCLLMEDTTGRVIYDTIDKLTTALRVKEIVAVPVMENCTRTDDQGKNKTLMALIVNLNDYNAGADKGGAVNMFDDFDIDYNQQKYLIETRCSGALVKPFSAIAIESVLTTEG